MASLHLAVEKRRSAGVQVRRSLGAGLVLWGQRHIARVGLLALGRVGLVKGSW